MQSQYLKIFSCINFIKIKCFKKIYYINDWKINSVALKNAYGIKHLFI